MYKKFVVTKNLVSRTDTKIVLTQNECLCAKEFWGKRNIAKKIFCLVKCFFAMKEKLC